MSKTKTIIAINPPPEDACCEVCGRHISELKPFQCGDPSNPFNGSLLLKDYRSMAPKLTDEQLEEYKAKHGERETNFYVQLMDSISASWECSYCFRLSDEEYFEKINEKRQLRK